MHFYLCEPFGVHRYFDSDASENKAEIEMLRDVDPSLLQLQHLNSALD